jgi:hypothetical protein
MVWRGRSESGRALEPKQNFAYPVRPDRRLTNAVEPTLLEYANGARVRSGNVRMDWPMVFVTSQEFVERQAGNTSPPILPADPVTNQTFAVSFPAGYVAGHLIVDHNRPRFIGRVPEDLVPPMGHESVPFPGRESRHRGRLPVALMLEEDWEVALHYVTKHRRTSSFGPTTCGSPARTAHAARGLSRNNKAAQSHYTVVDTAPSAQRTCTSAARPTRKRNTRMIVPGRSMTSLHRKRCQSEKR